MYSIPARWAWLAAPMVEMTAENLAATPADCAAELWGAELFPAALSQAEAPADSAAATPVEWVSQGELPVASQAESAACGPAGRLAFPAHADQWE